MIFRILSDIAGLVGHDIVGLFLDLIELLDPCCFGRDELVAEVDVLLKVFALLVCAIECRQQLCSRRKISLTVLQFRQFFDVLLLVSKSDDGLSEVVLDFLGLLFQFRLLRELFGQELWVNRTG